VIYDCIVVGAGPAGASAAYHLARRGFSVALVDKEKLPRYKPCGGGVLDRVADWFDFDFAPVISMRVQRVHMRSTRPGGFTGELELPRAIWMVHREVFDHFVVRQACARGAVLMEVFPVTAIHARSDGWTVASGESRVAGRYLIAADGAKGPLARWLGFDKREKLLAGALEAEIPAGLEPESRKPEPTMEFAFQDGLTGYAWNFPKADAYSVGVGAWSNGTTTRRERPLRSELETYCSEFGLEPSAGRVCGHPILLWNGAQTLHTHRALLAGEAACVVDPWNAEGIRPAMISGVKAAEAVAAALDGEDNALAGYSASIAKDLGAEMNIASAIGRRFYGDGGAANPPPSAARLSLWARLMCGDIGYRQFAMGSALLYALRSD
jgi:geranylgeranyl reductase family protein